MAESTDPDFFSHQVTEARRFYLGLALRPRDAYSVVCGGMERCEPQYRVSRAKFPFYSVEFVLRGYGEFRSRAKTHRLTPGTIFTYGPGEAHEITGDGRSPLVKYFLDFGGRRGREYLRTCNLQVGGTAQTSAPEHVRRIFEDLIDAGLRQSAYQSSICSVIGQHLLLRIAETSTPLSARNSIALGTYESCRQYIKEHYRSIESLRDLAGKCNFDPSYICRVFQRYEGQSPWKLIVQLRMRDAAERLQASGAVVKNVAAELGFKDVFQFSRTFRRVFGVSPRHFSNACRPTKVL